MRSQLGQFPVLLFDNVTGDPGSGGATYATDTIGGVEYPRAKVVWGPDGTANDTDVASGKPMPVQLRASGGTELALATAAKQPALGTAGSASSDVITVQGIASGTAQPVSLATAPALVAGAAIIGKVGIDQTTPGTTNAVSAVLTAGSAAIGKLAANSGIDIGDVDVTSIAAGDNNIGNVDIVTVPADPFGVNADAASATGSISAKLRFIAATGIPVTGTVTVGSHAVTVGSGGVASGAVASGAVASGAFASGSVAAGAFASGSIADGAQVTLGAKADAKSPATDTTAITLMQVSKQISASVQALATGTPAALGQTTMSASSPVTLASNQPRLPIEPMVIHVAATALTRPANTTAYSALDAISDNATAGSVTANSVTLSGVDDDPISIEEILLTSTDTGFGGKTIRVYLYNANPTSSSGVVGGDNAAFSNKQAGFIGSLIGTMLAFSDGCRGRCIPEGGVRILTTPTSGAKTMFWQLQTLDSATPSANSTTFTPTFKGFQGRAA